MRRRTFGLRFRHKLARLPWPRVRWSRRHIAPRTLFGQIVFALLAGIIVAQLAGAWLLIDERARVAEQLLGAHMADRIAGIVDALDKAAPEERARLARALDVPPTRVTLERPWIADADTTSNDVITFAAALQRELPRPLPVQVFAVERGQFLWPRVGRARLPNAVATSSDAPMATAATAPPPLNIAVPPPRHNWAASAVTRVVAQVRLSDGAVVTFRHTLPSAARDLPIRLLGWLLVVALITTALALWIVRRITRSTSALAEAATGLASNLDQPPLPATGPVEIAVAALAFNKMQAEIQRLLQTRATAMAALSHDLRLPITRVRLRAERIDDHDVRTAIDRDLDEMDRMIDNTLEYLRAGRSAEQKVALDLESMLDSIAQDFESLGARLNIRGQATAPLRARPQALQRCLANLIDNARRYGGGAVDVLLLDRGREIEIRVEDDGPGIPAAERERVFEPYVRLEESRAAHTGGAGLGLAIARAVARGHGGDLQLHDRAPGQGLSARLLLPRPQESTA